MRQENAQRLESYKIKKSFYYYLEHHFLIEGLKKAINSFAQGDVIDIGCGNKPYLGMFENRINSYTGCDIIQSSENCVDVICPAQQIPLPDASYDTVFSTQTIEHVGDFQGMLNESFRLLKPGGHIIVSGPMYWPLHEEPYDYFRFTKHGFKFALENSGFEVLEVNPNGGKWALFGQTILLTFPVWLTFPRFLRTAHNLFYSWLDKKFFDPVNTMNYVAVARKPKHT
ncbi:MAG: class I SAM-dependent methyltransferase [Bacteroidetes bacterium]|nr:class I SAM-dependent methyltransferase [Bacteroidota bacterium]